jgi:diadenosine tetraphosphate (Ap4A) HIT family hydrolase
VSHGECPLCEIVSALARADVYRPPGGSAYRKVADLPASVAVLGPDQFYRGYTLVIARTHARELYELTEPEAAQYFRDMLGVARAIATARGPRKMNYELLGNTVAHLHWHLFPRYQGDPNPQRPVWEHPHEPRLATEQESAATVAEIRRHLAPARA